MSYATMSNASMQYIYPGLVRTLIQAERDGDRERYAAIEADLVAFRRAWSARDLAPLDANGHWPTGPRRWAAERDRLAAIVDRARKQGAEHWIEPQAALDRHLELGQSLGYVNA